MACGTGRRMAELCCTATTRLKYSSAPPPRARGKALRRGIFHAKRYLSAALYQRSLIRPISPRWALGRFLPPVRSALRRGAGHRKQRARAPLAARSARPARVGHIGAAGGPAGAPGSYWAALARHLGLGGSRIAPRCASGPAAPMGAHETGQYQGSLASVPGESAVFGTVRVGRGAEAGLRAPVLPRFSENLRVNIKKFI